MNDRSHEFESDRPTCDDVRQLPDDECPPDRVGPIEDWVRKLLDGSDVPIAIVIEGGHFDLRSGPDLFAESSLRCALTIGRRLIRLFGRKIRVIFSLLIDDLGLDCDGNTCSIGTDKTNDFDRSLPPKLEIILHGDCLVKRDRVIVETERHSRNRGLKHLKRLLENEPDLFEGVLTIEERDGFTAFVMQADDGLTVQVASRAGSRWTIKCPLIMAAHYTELVAK